MNSGRAGREGECDNRRPGPGAAAPRKRRIGWTTIPWNRRDTSEPEEGAGLLHWLEQESHWEKNGRNTSSERDGDWCGFAQGSKSNNERSIILRRGWSLQRRKSTDR